MKLNVKRWVSAGLAAAAVNLVLDAVIHGRLLMGLYQQTASVWRPTADAQAKMGLMTLGNVLFGLVCAWLYAGGYEPAKSGLGQGVRFGLAIGALLSILYACVWYVVLPIPAQLAAGWVASALVEGVCTGAVVGLLYRRA